MKVAYDVTMEVNKLGDDIKKVPYEVTMLVNEQGYGITSTIFLTQVNSLFVVPKLILTFTARGLSVQPSFKNLWWACSLAWCGISFSCRTLRSCCVGKME